MKAALQRFTTLLHWASYVVKDAVRILRAPLVGVHCCPTFPYLEEVWISGDVWHDFGHGASMETVAPQASLCSRVC